MQIQVLYHYLGTNGTILSPVHLEDAYYVRKLKLFSDEGKMLTKDNGKTLLSDVIIPEDELDMWKEIEAKP